MKKRDVKGNVGRAEAKRLRAGKDGKPSEQPMSARQRRKAKEKADGKNHRVDPGTAG